MPETPENLLKQLHENSQSYYKNADPLDRDKWPKEWLTTYYKEYPRFSSVVLPESKSKAGLVMQMARFIELKAQLVQGILLRYIRLFAFLRVLICSPACITTT